MKLVVAATEGTFTGQPATYSIRVVLHGLASKPRVKLESRRVKGVLEDDGRGTFSFRFERATRERIEATIAK
jgi:hypothetical protein